MANYYDSEDFNEGILDEGLFDEGIYDEASYDEGMLDEASRNRRKRPMKVPSSLGRPSNFGGNISRPTPSATGNFVTKSELKSSLNSISNQVNDLKKSSLTIASSLKRLDDGYEKVIKSIAKKDRSQDNLASNSTMMSLIGTLINKPTLNVDALTIAKPDATHTTDHIALVDGQDPVQVDLTKTLMFTMMPMMMGGNSSGGDNNSMMMLMMVLLLGNKSTTGTANNQDNTLLMMMPMMMMMNKK